MGKIIEIAGIDGSGKTTLCKRVCESPRLKDSLVFKNGFGSMRFNNEVQNYLNLSGVNKYDVFSHDLLNILYMMDLIVNTRKELVPVLKEKNIISDRYITSAKVYSLATTNSDISDLFDLYGLLPQADLIIYLDIDPDIAYKRILNRDKPMIYYENPEYFKLIQKTYKKILDQTDVNVIEIDGSLDEQTVTANVINIISEYIIND